MKKRNGKLQNRRQKVKQRRLWVEKVRTLVTQACFSGGCVVVAYIDKKSLALLAGLMIIAWIVFESLKK